MEWLALRVDDQVFGAYIFWASMLVVKMLLMVLLTGIQRFRKKVVANPEDGRVNMFGELEVRLDDPDVERVRRAHRNDLENILPFFAAGFLYLFANPNVTVAIWLFRIAAIARILHTFVYAVWIVPQPARFLTFFVCLTITCYMSIHCMVEFARYV